METQHAKASIGVNCDEKRWGRLVAGGCGGGRYYPAWAAIHSSTTGATLVRQRLPLKMP
jgi:hypothetical protein